MNNIKLIICLIQKIEYRVYCTYTCDYNQLDMERSAEIQLVLQQYTQDVSKNKLSANQQTIVAIKTLNYHQYVAVLQQFIPNICCVSVEEGKFIKMSCSNLKETECIAHSNYKCYPLTIKQNIETSELIGICPKQLFDTLVCVPKGKPLYVPVIAEHDTKRLHQMTLVVDTKINVAFLHDPNGRSIFNTDNTHILFQTYIESLNTVIDEYNAHKVSYVIHDFVNTNVSLTISWTSKITGNCVVASILFMILYNNVQNVADVISMVDKLKKKDYTAIYTPLYNKIKQYLALLA